MFGLLEYGRKCWMEGCDEINGFGAQPAHQYDKARDIFGSEWATSVDATAPTRLPNTSHRVPCTYVRYLQYGDARGIATA